MSNSGQLYSVIYDAVMKLLVNHRISLDELSHEITKMNTMFGAYYSDEHLDEELLLRNLIFDFGVFEGVLVDLLVVLGLAVLEHDLRAVKNDSAALKDHAVVFLRFLPELKAPILSGFRCYHFDLLPPVLPPAVRLFFRWRCSIRLG